uniref:Uncharacterized protein n=1 Tax=Avena sativa TaxID=4498 RepID=A0ACD5VYM3_AVESA
MPTRRRGSGHGGGRGRLPVAVEPQEVDETTKTCATGERMVLPGPAPPRADHDPYRNQSSRGSSGGRTGPAPSRAGAQPVPCQDHVTSPPSAQPDVSYLDKLLGNTTLKESPVAATSSPILVRKPPDWYFTFYIRTGLLGSFHTYPSLDGPFKSLQEAEDAINRHLHGLTDPKMSKDSLDKLSIRERAVRKALYFPDGTRKKCLEPLDETLDEIDLLVRALVDQYNDDQSLLGDLALQLKDIQHEQFFFSEGDLYHHFNFTAKAKGVVDSFFAEVKCTRGEDEEMVPRCFSVLRPNDDGLCYGCQNNGAVDMKHPNKADAYCRGLVHEYMPSLGGYHTERRVESVEDEEERLRYQFKCFDDPRFMAEHFRES